MFLHTMYLQYTMCTSRQVLREREKIPPSHLPREMENISRGPTFGDFVTVPTEGSMQDVTVASLPSTRVQTLLSPLFKCNVLRESLSVDSKKYSLRNT